ncbi:hypothetical protein RclHR1_01450005 [Rhizophagus clarus]|uniref:Uncharacterized protein n=1 Tax=Rhizophagus clarus TaxID=94130 RepID=A0A2Z6QCU9_9GLOM|nr:hypothetical protein RclHR1_01450005 [Rhizophagus clarus]
MTNDLVICHHCPCGASAHLIQAVSQTGRGCYHVHSFINQDMNNIRDIGVNVTADKQRLFLIQAKVDDFRIINCPDQSLSGNLLSKYFDVPIVKKKKQLQLIIAKVKNL